MNLGNCSKADDRESVSIAEDADFACPECGHALYAADGGRRFSGRQKAGALAAAVVLLVGGTSWALLHNRPATPELPPDLSLVPQDSSKNLVPHDTATGTRRDTIAANTANPVNGGSRRTKGRDSVGAATMPRQQGASTPAARPSGPKPASANGPSPAATPSTQPAPAPVTPAPIPSPAPVDTAKAPAPGLVLPAGTKLAVKTTGRTCSGQLDRGSLISASVTEGVAGVPAGSNLMLKITARTLSGSAITSVKVVGSRLMIGDHTIDLKSAEQAIVVDESRTASAGDNAKKIGTGAVVGAVVGLAVTKGSLSGAAKGAAIGAGAGTVAAVASGNDRCVAEGAEIPVILTGAVKVPTP